jgi:nucleoid-associated protein YgaU
MPVAGPGAGNPAGSTGPIVWKSDPPEITISDIIFEGLSTKIRCDGLFNWMSPPGGDDPFAATMAAMGRPIPSEVPTLRFLWGPPIVGFLYKVKLKRCQVTYERFNPTGIPVRAKISLTMQQVPDTLSAIPTNPTSGGAPGRRTHVLKDGESLAGIAHSYYGEAGAWRRIADINGIDDPSRVRPGTTVYLPNGQELEQVGGR